MRRFTCLIALLTSLWFCSPFLSPVEANPESFRFTDVVNPDTVPSWMVIVPEAGAEAVQPLATYRAEEGYTVRIVTTEEIYEGFSEGKASPEAIRAFIHGLRKVDEKGFRLNYLVLAGTADPRNDQGFYLPTWKEKARFFTRQFPCDEDVCGDHHYSTPPKSRIPDVAVGRLPARDSEQLKSMVSKTLAAERNHRPGPWRRSVHLVAGQGGFGKIIDSISERLFTQMVSDEVPYHFDVNLAYANPGSAYCYAPNLFSDYLVTRLNQGPGIMVYIGHGFEKGFDTFTWKEKEYPIMDGTDAVKDVDNPHHRTLIVSVACSTGRFDGKHASVGENLLTSPTGPAAFIGASRISHPYANAILGEFLVRSFMQDRPRTVGEGWLRVRRRFAKDSDASIRKKVDVVAALNVGPDGLPKQRRDQLMMYNLLGDPALKAGLVREKAEFTCPDEVRADVGIAARARFPFDSGRALFTLAIDRDEMIGDVAPVDEEAADWEKKMIDTNRAANDKVVWDAKIDFEGGMATWKAQIPNHVPAGTYNLSVYGWGPDGDAAASTTITISRE